MRKTFLPALLMASMVVPAAFAADNKPAPTAAELMHQGEATAQQQHKGLLIEFGASWCGNCKMFERLLNDPATGPILAKEFVVINLDDGERKEDKLYLNNAGAAELRTKMGGTKAGWPFLVMARAGGRPMVNSLHPVFGKGLENIGYPALPAEIDWFMHMLKVAAPDLSKQDAATVRAWLNKNAPV